MNKEDQDHIASSCVDGTLCKIVVKACSFPSAVQNKVIVQSLFFQERNTLSKLLFLPECFLMSTLILGLLVTFSTV